MKHLILILILVLSFSFSAYSQDTLKADTISFYPEYSAIYRNHVLSVSLTSAGIALAAAPKLFNVQSKTAKQGIYAAGIMCGVFAIVCELCNIQEYGKIARKHKKLKFTSNGMILKF